MIVPTVFGPAVVIKNDAGIIDYHDLDTGGMPAYRRALRTLEAQYLELSDRFAQHLAAHAVAVANDHSLYQPQGEES